MKLHAEQAQSPCRPRSRAQGLAVALLALAVLPITPASAGQPRTAAPATGPAADYPVMIGAPFTVDGVTYTPADKLNSDQVGYAVIDPAAGAGISLAHRTLPVPSYVEVTSLRSGRTILVRVEQRGPMQGDALVALSAGAASQLGIADPRTPVRVRRVNPAEPERALLRAGQRAPERMDTPMSLVAVLLRKLDPAPVVPPVPATSAPAVPIAPHGPKPALVAEPKPTPAPGAAPVKALPKPVTPPQPVVVAKTAPAPKARGTARPAVTAVPAAASRGTTVVQVGAFSSKAAAARVASRVGGVVTPAGKLFRVRIGSFADAGAAGAALAKARAAGYSEARIQHAD